MPNQKIKELEQTILKLRRPSNRLKAPHITENSRPMSPLYFRRKFLIFNPCRQGRQPDTRFRRKCPHISGSALVDAIALLGSGIRTCWCPPGDSPWMRALHLHKRPKTIPMKQACASIGQIQLMQCTNLFSKHAILRSSAPTGRLRNKKDI